jgi:hypothetical protein
MSVDDGKLRAIVRHYRLWKSDRDREEKWWVESIDLRAAVERAAKSMIFGARHGHQHRLKRADLAELARLLTQPEVLGLIDSCREFAEIFAVVTYYARQIWRHPEMTIYDVADRIALYKNIAPRMIYLHRGTRDGARALGLEIRGLQEIGLELLPLPLQVLSTREAEDVLCIYKDVFAGKKPIPTDPQRGCTQRPRRRMC